MWKIINNIIPNKVNIRKKGIDLNPLCTICGKKLEPSCHLIWDCKISKEVWRTFIPNSSPLFSLCKDNWSAMDHWNWMVDKLNREDLSKGVIIMWAIWNHRNKSSVSKSQQSQILLFPTIEANLQERKKGYLKNQNPVGPRN